MNSESQEFKPTGCCRVAPDPQKSENKTQHSCCKLDSYNYLEDLDMLSEHGPFDCVEVRFKNSRKDFFRIPEGLRLFYGDIIAVEASPGHDIGVVCLTGETARLQMIKKGKSHLSEDIKKVYRKARPNDLEKWSRARSLERDTMVKTRRIVGKLGLNMKINDVEYQGDATKVIFYYTADERVDFRQLIKILADEFSVRIEMKQIGVRQESGRLGGIGPCGRELCCSSWMSRFRSVSTTSARTQNLSLNPQKLAGQCGKLKCCLNFEQEVYAEEAKLFPDTKKRLKTKKGEAFFRKMDILKGEMWYSYTEHPENFIKIQRDKVDEILQLNAKDVFPESLDAFGETHEEAVKFDQVVGQDDLSRFDNPQKKSNARNRKRGRNNRNAKGNPKNQSRKSNNRNQKNHKPKS
jgi:cell fate regulator YaaT (PSP1 superfamily)